MFALLPRILSKWHARRHGGARHTGRATPQALDDNAFLDFVQRTAFDYFWYEANPENGLIRDRSIATSPANIAAVGFGLSAYTRCGGAGLD
jgi:hypothetical protein